MATNTLIKSIHHHNHHNHHSLSRIHHSTHCPPSSSFFFKPTIQTTTPSISLSSLHHFIKATSSTASASAAASTASAATATAFDILEQHLSAQDFRQADEETRRLIIVLAGEDAKKRGYVFFSEAQFIPEADLKAIDELWMKYSNNRFGYSVQKKIWSKVNKDFTNFFIKVGWMKKLESSEVDQYNYRSFPNEFMWELNDETPEGHLPLTNALRGTQLLNSILSHPAFIGDDEEQNKEETTSGEDDKGSVKKGLMGGLSSLFKTDYSF